MTNISFFRNGVPRVSFLHSRIQLFPYSLFLAAVFLFSSCRKDDDEIWFLLQGKWEYGNLDSGVEVRKTLIFRNDNTYFYLETATSCPSACKIDTTFLGTSLKYDVLTGQIYLEHEGVHVGIKKLNKRKFQYDGGVLYEKVG